jgi:hypothetical protein
MAQQGKLFPEPDVVVGPSSACGEPRLWVRRLIIYEKPGAIIRDIRLKRGLNIIWSPDPGEESAIVGRGLGSGHGAGKTLFCRLIRYCLGEDTFANDDLRRNVAEQLPTGLVGIEALINSVQWAALRPIGTNRRQMVRTNATLEDLVESTDPSTGLQPLLEALDSLVAPDVGRLFIPSSRAHSAWLFALAWLTRDQECRYDHILDWRHARADTRSPVIGTAREQMVVAVRFLIGVLDQEEIRLKDERDGLAEERRSLERDLTYYQRRVEQLRADLSSVLGTLDNVPSGGEIELGEWRTQAEARLQLDLHAKTTASKWMPSVPTLPQRVASETACWVRPPLLRATFADWKAHWRSTRSRSVRFAGNARTWMPPRSGPDLVRCARSAMFQSIGHSRKAVEFQTYSPTPRQWPRRSAQSPTRCGTVTPPSRPAGMMRKLAVRTWRSCGKGRQHSKTALQRSK